MFIYDSQVRFLKLNNLRLKFILLLNVIPLSNYIACIILIIT